MTTKNDIYREHLKEWLLAKKDKKKRGEIIKHICFVTKVHPKSVPRSFRRLQLRGSDQAEKRGRKVCYTLDVVAALKNVWNMASEPCGENLYGILGEYVRILTRDGDWDYGEQVTAKLLNMSLGTMKKRVATFVRKQFLIHGKSTTEPSSIHTLIPLRTGPWDTDPVGTLQIDTVAHCGGSVAGDFIYTVNSTDVSTLWGARRAQWNKGQVVTVESMKAMEKTFPFPVVEWHPDSGSEFINWHCKEWCEGRGQKLTRSRPNKKNDNCFVEERNGHIVRRWVGYARFDVREVVDALNALYDVLTPYINHFVASCRTVTKEKVGARWKITREKISRTPYERVLQRSDVSEKLKIQLRQEHERLNPFRMKCEIDQLLHRVVILQKHHGIPDLTT